VEVSIGETEEEIIDNFLSYWVDPDQQDNANSCIFVAENCDVVTGTDEDAQSIVAVASVKRSLSGDKYSEDSSDDNDPLILLSDRQIIEFIAGIEHQNYVLITDDEMVTTEILAGESIEDCIESFSKEMTGLWHELWVLEQRLEAQRISVQSIQIEMNENKEVPEHKGIFEEDDVEERLTDNLKKDWNQHVDMLIEKREKTEHQFELLPKGDKAQQPYDFNFNKFFVSAGDVKDSSSFRIVSREGELLR